MLKHVRHCCCALAGRWGNSERHLIAWPFRFWLANSQAKCPIMSSRTEEVNFFKHSAEIMWEITLLVVWWPIAVELIAILMSMGERKNPQKTYPQLNSNFQLAPFSLGLWSVYYQNADLQVENIQSNEYVCICWSPQEVSPNEVLTLMSPTW